MLGSIAKFTANLVRGTVDTVETVGTKAYEVSGIVAKSVYEDISSIPDAVQAGWERDTDEHTKVEDSQLTVQGTMVDKSATTTAA